MTTYKEIFGKPVKVVSSDPTDAGAEGQVWYNSTLGSFRSVVAGGAMSSGATANVAGYNLGGAGTTTAGLAMGGANTTGTGSLTSTEEYNGSGWSVAEDLPGATSYTGGCGTQTAALLAGGGTIPAYTSTTSRHYDGTNWSSGGTMNTATGSTGQLAGILTAALIAGGDRVPAAPRSIANAEEYNGSSWTSVTSLPAVRQNSGVAGIQTAALYWGGYSDTNPGTTNTQLTSTLEYDGTNWTATGNLPAARKGAGGTGTQSDALSFGGNPGTTPTNMTQILNYNGTTWSVNPASLASGRQLMANSASGPSSSAFLAKGVTTAVTAITEEWNFTANTITAAAWASGGNMNTARAYLFGLGPQTAAIGAGGYISTFAPTANSEEYNGTSWTEGNNLNTARYGLNGLGTQTAAVAVGGYNYLSNNEHYNGTSWTNATAYPTVIIYTAGAGTQTAGVIFGGAIPSGRTAQTTEYDGSSWTTSSPQNLNTARSSMGSGGTQTAAIGFGGSEPAASNKTETYNGSTWTVGGTLLNSFPGRNMGGGGPNTSTTDILAAGGPPHKTEVEGYDGSAWSTRPSLALGRSNLAGGSTSSSGVVFGGDSAPEVYTAATEEFTGDTTSLNYKNISSS